MPCSYVSQKHGFCESSNWRFEGKLRSAVDLPLSYANLER